MTRLFDNSSRESLASQLPFGELEATGHESPGNLNVMRTSVSHARGYIAEYHYSHLMPDSTREVFVGYYGDKIGGFIVYGMGVGPSQYSALIPWIKAGQYRELTRLWSPDGMPRNTESRLIAESLKFLPPEVKLIISFSDSGQNHIGTIYQATNFLYCGTTTASKMLQDADGHIRHPKSIHIARLRHPELAELTTPEIMAHYGWTSTDGSIKHRYVFLRGSHREIKRMKRNLTVLPYPKQAGEVSREDTSAPTDRAGSIPAPRSNNDEVA